MVSALEKNRAGKEDGECWVGEQSHHEERVLKEMSVQATLVS